MIQCSLTLYIAGQTAVSKQAMANLDKICKQLESDSYKLDVIDILERPQLAEEKKILATPTLVRSLPIPVRRVVGDLSDIERVLMILDLK